MFVKFSDNSIRDGFIAKVISQKPEYEGEKLWAQAESPVETRACENILSGLKKMLVGWGFDPSAIEWDTKGTENTLKVKNEIKVSVSVREGKLHCEWEQSWRERVSFFPSSELQALTTQVTDMLAGVSKGKGKGKCNFE